MSMKLYLKKYTGDNRNLDKWTVNTLSDTYKTVEVYNTTSLLAPQVVLDFDSAILSSGYNYAYIDKYDRYYYITDMAADSGKKIIISLSVDVLNTYKNQIVACPVTVLRQEGAYNSYVADDRYPLDTDKKWHIRDTGPETFVWNSAGDHYVLGVIGLLD